MWIFLVGFSPDLRGISGIQAPLSFNIASPSTYPLESSQKDWGQYREGTTHRCLIGISSVQFSHSVLSSSLQPHESQHTRPPCTSPIPGVYPNSCPSSRWSPSPPAPNPSQHQGLFQCNTYPLILTFHWPKLVTWPHLAVREPGKCSSWLGESHNVWKKPDRKQYTWHASTYIMFKNL